MSAPSSGGTPHGIDRVWRLTAEGYRIVDVDSDDLFVGIKMEKQGRVVTLLLTREDFTSLFPNAQSFEDVARGHDGPHAEINEP